MPAESAQKQAELIRSLASTIQKKIVSPAAGRMNLLGLELKETGRRLDLLEKEFSRLAAAHRRTRLLAVIALAGLGLFLAGLVISLNVH
ncbi:MAG: hypothetical protein K6T29_05005 [Peptococcaceae bacterium]|nr:hypothetical protein [Peptococcaceae bacterium]